MSQPPDAACAGRPCKTFRQPACAGTGSPEAAPGIAGADGPAAPWLHDCSLKQRSINKESRLCKRPSPLLPRRKAVRRASLKPRARPGERVFSGGFSSQICGRQHRPGRHDAGHARALRRGPGTDMNPRPRSKNPASAAEKKSRDSLRRQRLGIGSRHCDERCAAKPCFPS